MITVQSTLASFSRAEDCGSCVYVSAGQTPQWLPKISADAGVANVLVGAAPIEVVSSMFVFLFLRLRFSRLCHAASTFLVHAFAVIRLAVCLPLLLSILAAPL